MGIIPRVKLLLTVLALSISLCAADHPFLLATDSEIAAAKEKAKRLPWAGAALAALMKSADAALGRTTSAPEKVGQWSHWYSCPKHGVTLRTVSPTEHRCPVDGQVFTGDPYDAVVVGREHSRLTNAVRDLGLAYRFTREVRYARHAAAILLSYAGRYQSYPRHNTRGQDAVGGGKVLAQTLDESVWLIPLSWGYDMIWDTLSPADRERIEAGVLLPAAELIREHKMRVHNIQCWKNSAVGLVGLVTGREDLVRDAVDDPDRGFRRQISEGVTADGLWYEGSLGYHAYTLQALWPLAEAMRHAGVDLYSDRYRSALIAPLNLALPDGDPPGFNDSRGSNVRNLAPLYELAYARWKAPEFGSLLAGSTRESLQALLHGQEKLPGGPVVPEQSVLMRDAGFAVLRVRAADRVDALAVRFGRHGGGHGHPDKPGIVLHAAGMLMAVDPGSIAYGVPLHQQWYRQSVAHNTVVVDSKSQSTADGTLETWEAGEGKAALVATANEAYPGVKMRRSLSLAAKGRQSTITDAFEVSSDGEHSYDWVLHVEGQLSSSLKFAPCEPAGDANGYQHITGWQCAATDSDWEATWTNGSARLVLRMKGAPGTRVYRGVGPGRNPTDGVPLVLVRRRGMGTTFDSTLAAASVR